MKAFFNNLLDMVYPPACLGCNAYLPKSDNVLCMDCMDALPYTYFFTAKENPVLEKFYGRINVSNAGSMLFFTKDSLVQTLMFALKYQNEKKVGRFLGALLAGQLAVTHWIKDVDVIVPLPLHKKRLQKRGYNQSAIIAEVLAAQLSVTLDTESVLRPIHTETQTHKTREARWTSMQNIFTVAAPEKLRNKHVLLVDDVITTGATLEVCGTEILKVPGTKLSIVTAAFAL